ncbi:hypothetical protein [Streptomyces sp. NPDC093970]|uniref:hypothetical protein n=1 Tax=Streptomyces sp. NPDC093970 TaxID=3155076 RepID=UPI00341325F2
MSAAEVDRELRELYEALVVALRQEAADVHSEQTYEVLALWHIEGQLNADRRPVPVTLLPALRPARRTPGGEGRGRS